MKEKRRSQMAGFGSIREGLVPIFVITVSMTVAFPIFALIRRHHATQFAQYLLLSILISYIVIALYRFFWPEVNGATKLRHATQTLMDWMLFYVITTIGPTIVLALLLLTGKFH